MIASISARPSGRFTRTAASQPGPRSVRVALRRADGHALAAGDFLEAEVERVLEHDDRRLRGRDLRQAGAERGPQLRGLGRARGVAVARLAGSSSSGSQRRAS